MKTIQRKYGDGICRRCLNKEYHTRLIPEDCHYFIYPRVCPCCGRMNNIVEGVRLRGHLKMLLRG